MLKQKEHLILVYLPIDFRFIIKRFVKYWKPDLTIFMESEIWPNIINELHNKKLRFSIINARMSDKSFFGGNLLIFLLDLCSPK